MTVVPRPSFWEGAARLMDFPALLVPRPTRSSSVASDWQALAEDWRVVGQEIHSIAVKEAGVVELARQLRERRAEQLRGSVERHEKSRPDQG